MNPDDFGQTQSSIDTFFSNFIDATGSAVTASAAQSLAPSYYGYYQPYPLGITQGNLWNPLLASPAQAQQQQQSGLGIIIVLVVLYFVFKG